MKRLARLAMLLACSAVASAQQMSGSDWSTIDVETLAHFQALLRLDTQNPPGNETRAVDYLQRVLEQEGIATRRFAQDPARANLVARIPGTGKKRPLLLVGHTDVVTVDSAKWTFPPFSATRDGGYVYGRGAQDMKDKLTAALMVMINLQRRHVPLDRDVILLAESGEEGTTRVGVDYMVSEHFDEIAAEFCLNEGGSVVRRNGHVLNAAIGTTEKVPRTLTMTATGPSGHASVPLRTNAVVHLSRAIAALAEWQAPIHLNDTTREYFRRLAEISGPPDSTRYRDLLSTDPRVMASAVEYFETQRPSIVALLRSTVSPTIVQGGTRVNVIPSEAKATLDLRTLPGDDAMELLEAMRHAVNDPAVQIEVTRRDGQTRPEGASPIDTDAFRAIDTAVKRHYNAVTLPSMGTGASDSAQLRAKGVQCYGIGPAVDSEDAPKGYGAHSDQERILESDLYQFVRFYWDVVVDIAGTK
jgi:acetylornithine deacetylase/succinyl-diaminopimelate desuccinylase-like protein